MHPCLLICVEKKYQFFFFFSYGDRCPKSISGRLFAIVWILTGICMCSIFTAMLTTALTTISLDTEIALQRSKVSSDGS